jgi:heptosyltransferase-2
MTKNLIIKTTYSKLPDGSLKSNLGDLLRSTVLLECIGDSFLWLTDERGKNLLKWFVGPENIITLGKGIRDSVFSDPGTIYNIDNYIHSQDLFERLKGNWRGFIRDGKGRMQPENEIIAQTEPYCNVRSEISFQQALVEGLGFQWQGQDYAPCKIQLKPTAHVGLNLYVHPGWKSKCWPEAHWKDLGKVLRENLIISWQKGLNDFDEYINWLASSEVIVTPDTLGLHLASALRKKVVAIIGPTESREFHYSRVVFLRPDQRDCMPCNAPVCIIGESCISEITVEQIADTVMGML